MRRASPDPVRGSRTTARMRFSVTPSRAAISGIETPRLSKPTILCSRLALTSRAARRA